MVPVGSFVAIDVETANSDRGSICQIGLVRFERGREVACLSMVIDPEAPFDPMNTSIHGICADWVGGRPTFAGMHDTIKAWIDGQMIVSHSLFDQSAFAAAFRRYGISMNVAAWANTCDFAQKLWAPPHDLASLAQRFDIPLNHHDALSDARAAGLLMVRVLRETGKSCLTQFARGEFPPSPPLAPERNLAGLSGSPANQFRARSARERNGEGNLTGQVIVFTGDLSIDRLSAAEMAAAAGADVKDNVSRKTTMLVVGERDLQPGWQSKSTKHRRAEELIAGGCAISIIGEELFILLAKNTLQDGGLVAVPVGDVRQRA